MDLLGKRVGDFGSLHLNMVWKAKTPRFCSPADSKVSQIKVLCSEIDKGVSEYMRAVQSSTQKEDSRSSRNVWMVPQSWTRHVDMNCQVPCQDSSEGKHEITVRHTVHVRWQGVSILVGFAKSQSIKYPPPKAMMMFPELMSR